jgi:hypothetical protein
MASSGGGFGVPRGAAASGQENSASLLGRVGLDAGDVMISLIGAARKLTGSIAFIK